MLCFQYAGASAAQTGTCKAGAGNKEVHERVIAHLYAANACVKQQFCKRAAVAYGVLAYSRRFLLRVGSFLKQPFNVRAGVQLIPALREIIRGLLLTLAPLLLAFLSSAEALLYSAGGSRRCRTCRVLVYVHKGYVFLNCVRGDVCEPARERFIRRANTSKSAFTNAAQSTK